MKSTKMNDEQIQNEVMRELNDDELDGANGGTGLNNYTNQPTQEW